MRSDRGSAARAGWAASVAAAAALLLGGLTSFAQGFLPEPVGPLANSPSGWTLLTVLVLWWLRARTWVMVVLGAVCFVLLVVGYALVSTARGNYYNPLLWSTVGVVAGPFVGWGVAWARQRAVPLRAALGFGFLAGLLLGDGISGYVRVRDTTGWFYWVAMGVGAVAWVVVVALRRLTTQRDRLVLLGMTAVTGAAVVGGLELFSAVLS